MQHLPPSAADYVGTPNMFDSWEVQVLYPT